MKGDTYRQNRVRGRNPDLFPLRKFPLRETHEAKNMADTSQLYDTRQCVYQRQCSVRNASSTSTACDYARDRQHGDPVAQGGGGSETSSRSSSGRSIGRHAMGDRDTHAKNLGTASRIQQAGRSRPDHSGRGDQGSSYRLRGTRRCPCNRNSPIQRTRTTCTTFLFKSGSSSSTGHEWERDLVVHCLP